jgi:signal transduction histidine kinase
MLAFSRSGESISLNALNPVTVIHEAVSMLRPLLPSSISLIINIPDDVPLILANPVKLHQVLMNLCINSRDAMDNKGNITISVTVAKQFSERCHSCHLIAEGDYVELSVSDNGPGISDEIREKIFDPFFTTKEVGKGTGMGLSLIHGIMHEQDGHIIVPKVSSGAKISLLFPIVKKSALDTIREEVIPSKLN